MKTKELQEENREEAARFDHEEQEFKAGFHQDSPEFLKAEAERKADRLADIRIYEIYNRPGRGHYFEGHTEAGDILSQIERDNVERSE